MPTLELHQPFETTEPRLRVENILLPGRHRFRLIVVDDDGIESDPVDTLITIVAPAARSDVVARAREARGRLFYATGVLLHAQNLDADQPDNHRGLARARTSRTRSSPRGTRATTRATRAAPPCGRSPNTSSDRIPPRCSSRAWSSRPRCRPAAGDRFAPLERWRLTTGAGGSHTPLPRSPGGAAYEAPSVITTSHTRARRAGGPSPQRASGCSAPARR